jgi:hypothetical protein
MPLSTYKDSGLLFNQNFLEQTSQQGLFGYRGELVLIKGEVADDKGHAKPPVQLMRGVAILADDKMKMIIGALDQLQSINTFIEKYKNDFADGMQAVLFVVDLTKPAQVELEGVNFILIPLVQGVPWNEMIDELGLEKSDFKGQSAADKLVTLSDELKSYRPSYPAMSLDEAMTLTGDIKREAWGAV